MYSDVVRRVADACLTYSAPSLDPDGDGTPELFVNPFPELNDLGSDGTRSAFPRRAKYNLALGSMLVPSGVWKAGATLTAEQLEFLPPGLRNLARNEPSRGFHVPGELGDIKQFVLDDTFEVIHKQLGATRYKHALRVLSVAPFYSKIERALSSGQEISVPIVAAPNGLELERDWGQICRVFSGTRLVDEAVSLLACVIALGPTDRAKWEEQWIRAEVEEAWDGALFADTYKTLRQRFPPEECRSADDQVAMVDRLVLWAKIAFYGGESPAPTPPARPSSIAEGTQRLLALADLRDVRRRLSGERVWSDLIGVFFQFSEDLSQCRVRFRFDPTLLDLLRAELVPRSGERRISIGLVHFPNIVMDDEFYCFLAGYFLVMEAIRQQLCTGVGLICPFAEDGSSCCQYKSIVGRAWEVARPRRNWATHWREPVCWGQPD